MKKRKKLPFLYWVFTYLPLVFILTGSIVIFIENWRIGLGLACIAFGVLLVKLTASTLKAIRTKHRNG